MSGPSYIETFRRHWEDFPEPALLVGAGQAVLAANARARRQGPADLAMSPREGFSLMEGRPVNAYRLPVPGHDGLYLQFCIGLAGAPAPALE